MTARRQISTAPRSAYPLDDSRLVLFFESRALFAVMFVSVGGGGGRGGGGGGGEANSLKTPLGSS